MPALPPAPNVIKIEFEYSPGGTLRAGNRIYMAYTGGPPTAANLNTLSSDVSTLFGTDLASLLNEAYGLSEVQCTDLTSDSAAQGLWTGNVPGTRSNGGVNIPISTCVLQNFVIARRYRGGKPKTYWPFGVDSDLTSSAAWSTDLQTAVAAGWTSFLAALIAETGIGCTLTDHVNVSYYSGFASVENPVTHRWRNIPTPRVGDAVVDIITGNAVRLEIGSQRRRRTSTRA